MEPKNTTSASSRGSPEEAPDLGPVPDFVLPDWSGKDRTPPPMTPDELYQLSRQFPAVATPRPPMPDFEL